MPLSTSFESARLYGAREAFATARGFLLDERPRVLALSSLQAPEVPGLVSIGPPEALPLRPNQPDQKRSPEPARAFNPSIALAPHGLCPRCKYAMTLRVDTLHQCDSESSPYNGGPPRLANGNWFQGTVVGILDAELRLLGWTWLLNAPAYQIASADQNASTARRAGCLLAGASDGFRMSWAKQTFDARLLHWKVSVSVSVNVNWKVSAADERRWALRMAMGSVRMARLLRSVLSDGLLCAHSPATDETHSQRPDETHSRRLTKLSTSSPAGRRARHVCVLELRLLRLAAALRRAADGRWRPDETARLGHQSSHVCAEGGLIAPDCE